MLKIKEKYTFESLWQDQKIVKEYNKKSKSKDLEKEIEKIWPIRVTVGALCMIKLGTDKDIYILSDGHSQYKIHLVGLPISLREYNQFDPKMNTEKNAWNTYNRWIPSPNYYYYK